MDVGYEKKCVTMRKENKPFELYASHCEQYGGNPVYIETEAENKFIANFIKENIYKQFLSQNYNYFNIPTIVNILKEQLSDPKWDGFNYNGVWLGLTDLYSRDPTNPVMEWYHQGKN